MATLGVLLMVVPGYSLAREKEREYGFIMRDGAGVGAAVTYRSEQAPKSLAQGTQSESSSVIPSDSGEPTLIANRCTGLTSANSFSQFSNSTTCTSFAAPAPPTIAAPNNVRPRRTSPEEIATALAQRSIALAPRPRLRAAPSGVGLTGLDSFFWLAEEPRPISASAGVVTAEARPSQYAWDFDDGDQKTTSNSGRRWTARRDGNISHMYESRGSYRVSVDVIWQARWRIGAGPWQPLGYFTTSDSTDYPVRQVVALLVKPR
ncbi:MAG TPA: hypothetical protein VE174_02540 [Actinomycetota bacterium]|nr:hypothetical protein [Actinomycetota bacterium]